MKEIWKKVIGWGDRYEVSNHGRVKSLNYNKTGKEKLMSLISNNGYLCVMLSVNGKSKQCKVHRLVAEAFLDNPCGYPVVNHKDENTQNNFIWVNEDGSVDPDKSNLEWCSLSHNYFWGSSPMKVKQKMTNRTDLSTPVLKMDLEGNVICEYPSIMAAYRDNNYDPSLISGACKGKFKQGYGYKWAYKNK